MTRVLITYNVTPHIWGIAIISAPSKRRIQCLARLGFSMLLARGEARAYSHVAWLSVITFAYLIIELQELAWLIIPTLCLFCTLGIIVLYDVRYFVIPDKATSLLLVCGALVVLLIDANDLPVRTGAAIGAYGSLKNHRFDLRVGPQRGWSWPRRCETFRRYGTLVGFARSGYLFDAGHRLGSRFGGNHAPRRCAGKCTPTDSVRAPSRSRYMARMDVWAIGKLLMPRITVVVGQRRRRPQRGARNG